MNTSIREKPLRSVAMVLLVLVSLNALAAGYGFIKDPAGKGLGIGTDYLRPGAPFHNFLVPGVVLFVVIGVGSGIVAVSAMAKYHGYKTLVALQGIIIAGWIVVQLFMVKSFHPLHLIIGLIGAVLFYVGMALKKNRRESIVDSNSV